MDQQKATQENLANQRKAALKFLGDYPNPDMETITFTNEGGPPGFGASWRVNAIVMVSGKPYQEILGLRLMAGDPLPAVDPTSVPEPVTVTYSDGSSEVLE